MYFLLTVSYLLPFISIECSLVLVFWEHEYYFSLFLLLSTTHIFHIPVRNLLSDVQLLVFPDVPQSNTTFRSLCNFCLLYLRALLIFAKQKPEQGKRIVPLTQPKALPWLQAGLPNTLSRLALSANLSTPLCLERENPLHSHSSFPEALQFLENPASSWVLIGTTSTTTTSRGTVLCLLMQDASAIAPNN